MPNNPMENLLLNCVVIKTHIKVPSGGKKLNLERLGIPVEVNNEDLITKGQIRILEKSRVSVFQKIRGRASAVIEKYGVPFSIGRLIPNERIEDVRTELRSLEQEFNREYEELRSKYDEIKQNLLSQWHREIISIAARHSNDERYIFEVMRRVEAEFPEFSHFEGRFGFSWKEYTDLNSMAEEFIAESTISILEKMREFAEKLRDRLQSENISERNLAPVRTWIESIRDAVLAFHNERINKMLEGFEVWTEEGVDSEVREYSNAANKMRSMLDDVIVACTEQVDEIAAESVQALTTQRRVIQRGAAS